jgi:hypothetical protein
MGVGLGGEHASTPAVTGAVARYYLAVCCVAALPFVELVAANPGEPIDGTRLALLAVAAVAVSAVLLFVAARAGANVGRAAVLLIVGLWLFTHTPLVASWTRFVGFRTWDPIAWGVVAPTVMVPFVPLSRRRWLQRWVVVVAPLVFLVPAAVAVGQLVQSEDPVPLEVEPIRAELDQRPNVYFFVADAYARPDVVKAKTGLGIDGFLDDLGTRRFVVSERATASYPFTSHSVASTLSMQYVGRTTTDALYHALRGNHLVRDVFEEAGYSYAHAQSGVWDGALCPEDADVCIGGASYKTGTDWALLRKTPLGDLMARATAIPTLATNTDPSHIVGELQAVRQPPEPMFTFVHLFSPHPPFTRRADCTVRDRLGWDITSWPRPEAYAEAITCLNHQLLAAFDAILDVDPDAVIILQGDHGSSFGWSPEERLPIMSAIRLPDECGSLVPDDLLAVNTFRIVLNCLGSPELPMLPARYFWAHYGGPGMAEITDEVSGLAEPFDE